MRIVLKITLIAIVISAMASCKAKTVFVPVETVKVEYRDRLIRDSVFQLDSVFLDRYSKGDTLFITKEKYKYIYKDKIVKDTVAIVDSIQVPYPVEIFTEVNRLSSFQSFQIWCGRILLLVIVGFFGYYLFIKKFF